MKVAHLCPTLCDPIDYAVRGILPARIWRGRLSLLQVIFPMQGSKPGLQNYRRILYQLNHRSSPGILEWVAYSFSRDSSPPRNQPGVSCMEADSLSTEPSGKPIKRGQVGNYKWEGRIKIRQSKGTNF